MSGFFQDLLSGAAEGLFKPEWLRDYTHASKTFRPNSYQNAPKLKFLFHVYFEINPAIYSAGIPSGQNFGLLVKTIKLPSYSFDTHTMNQYNRKRIVQTKIKYEPIDISFHDDAGNSINNMWYNYYTYYYKDALKTKASNYDAQSTLYKPSIAGDDDWGFIGETSSPSQTVSNATQGISKIPFFKNIQIYGLNQHNFVRYTLINPVITRFGHDTYDYAQGNGTMANQMTVDYETVQYAEGALNGITPSNTVPGFGLPENYDTTLSPIARLGSNASILGKGGLVDAGFGFTKALTDGNPLAAAIIAGTASSLGRHYS